MSGLLSERDVVENVEGCSSQALWKTMNDESGIRRVRGCIATLPGYPVSLVRGLP